MNDQELTPQFDAEMSALEESGAQMPFTLKPAEGFMLMSVLQFALRHPHVAGNAPAVASFARSLAQNIEKRLGNGRPAIAEVARRGWLEFDTKREEGEAMKDKAADGDPPPKQKPERTPENKAFESPENKAPDPKGRKRR